MVTTGVVREFDADEGWGVIDAPELPGGCWVHFSVIAMEGYRHLTARQRVTVRAEVASQDGFHYRAVKVWTGDEEPADATTGPTSSPAYRTSLTLTFDEPHPGPGIFA